jgi:hypothetical protein
LVAQGLKPKLMKLDNEALKLLKTYLHQHNITFQVVPPLSHRQNSAERAIISFKDHFIAGLCSTDKSFPIPFQSLDMLYFFLMHTIKCSACSRPTYFTPKSSTNNENDMWRMSWVQSPCVCVAWVCIHPWPNCAVTIRWRGCLPAVTRTYLYGFRCIPFRPV